MANETNTACGFLDSLERHDLSMLLRHCQAAVKEAENALDWLGDLTEEVIVVRAPVPIVTSTEASSVGAGLHLEDTRERNRLHGNCSGFIKRFNASP